MSRRNTDPIEIDGIEYGPGSAERETVDRFRVGDRIGDHSQPYLITKSEQNAADPDCWDLSWIKNGEQTDFTGAKTAQDYRWVQTLYVIQETP